MIDPERLKKFLDALVKDMSLKMKPDGTTFCNVGVERVAALYDYGLFSSLTAREMIVYIKGRKEWLSCSGKQAADYALRGGFAVSFMDMQPDPHDHVATVYPAQLQLSGSLGRDVPMVANVGKKNGVVKSSEAFPVSRGEASYAILLEA